MLKMKFDDLLVSVVVAIVIFFNTLSTTMLNKGIFHVNASTLLLVVLLLALRFWNKINVSYMYLLFSLALLSIGVLVYVKTGRLNFLVYSLLMSLLISADRKVVLRTYIFVGGSVLVSVFFLSLLKVIPNLQYSRGGVIRNSFGFIYPTDFASHCFYLFIAISYC